jgi:hypothetical protein
MKPERVSGLVLKIYDESKIHIAGGISSNHYIDGFYAEFNLQGKLLRKWILSQSESHLLISKINGRSFPD